MKYTLVEVGFNQLFVDAVRQAERPLKAPIVALDEVISILFLVALRFLFSFVLCSLGLY
jgi:hypothetical protein